MRDRLLLIGQFLFTVLVAGFLVVPALLSIMAGVTVNYFRGSASGMTLQWCGRSGSSMPTAFSSRFARRLALAPLPRCDRPQRMAWDHRRPP